MSIYGRVAKIEEAVAGRGTRERAIALMKRLGDPKEKESKDVLLLKLWALNNKKAA